MKITKEQLKQIIKEELDAVVNEQGLSEAGYTPPQTRGDALGQLEQMADRSPGSFLGQGMQETGLTEDGIFDLVKLMFKPPMTLDIRNPKGAIENLATKFFDAMVAGGSNNPAGDSRKWMAHAFTNQVGEISRDENRDNQTLARFFKDNLDTVGKVHWAPKAAKAADEKSRADARADLFK